MINVELKPVKAKPITVIQDLITEISDRHAETVDRFTGIVRDRNSSEEKRDPNYTGNSIPKNES